jgi:hypothetical protein
MSSNGVNPDKCSTLLNRNAVMDEQEWHQPLIPEAAAESTKSSTNLGRKGGSAAAAPPHTARSTFLQADADASSWFR